LVLDRSIGKWTWTDIVDVYLLVDIAVLRLVKKSFGWDFLQV
jgi:hypothetical protein